MPLKQHPQPFVTVLGRHLLIRHLVTVSDISQCLMASLSLYPLSAKRVLTEMKKGEVANVSNREWEEMGWGETVGGEGGGRNRDWF